ncbi:putative methyl-accepting chemotaxis protein YoaH [Posidoniimonas corsicana]|uniref:Putative methyl-accepting chemotaxis protein YoaH n=1 Tax=Posidoniimonas corsicana TaxID=1938618 RepID=A0A5C5VDV8_9BACT|nr:methyl-accepting chemotaxis protein [Posidoniimonas corsicana]TWT36183.1 putative methyl-accepting chemotaxis protein YoaH [Posidoniimonas corsicana]
MNTKQKIAVLVAVSCLSLLLLIGIGWRSLSQQVTHLNDIVDQHFLVLLDEEISPLIQDEILPVINEDFVETMAMQQSIAMLIDADRDAYQSLLAEVEIRQLAGREDFDQEKYTELVAAHEENLSQIHTRVTKASDGVFSDASKESLAVSLAKFNDWKIATQELVQLASAGADADVEQIESLSQQAMEAFDAFRGPLDVAKETLQLDIADAVTAIKAKKDRINESEQRAAESREAVVATAGQTRLSASQAVTGFLAVGGAAIAITATLGVLISWSLIKPLMATIAMLDGIAQAGGDLTQRMATNRKDEFGTLAKAFNRFIEKIQATVTHVAENSKVLVASAAELNEAAARLAEGAADTSLRSSTVAASSEETSVSMAQILQTTQTMNNNFKAVSEAVDEMTQNISGIAGNTEQSSSIASDASVVANASHDKMMVLRQSATEIGRVTEVIQEIAEQTNLLALNATIEASRAGAAGRGFAVVAAEVKELAKQTAEATDDIRRRVAGIQKSSDEAVDSITQVNEVVSNVQTISTSIAAAVEDQRNVANKICQQFQSVTEGVQTVTHCLDESSVASVEATQNIIKVDEVAKRTAQDAAQAGDVGNRMTELANRLEETLSQFRY